MELHDNKYVRKSDKINSSQMYVLDHNQIEVMVCAGVGAGVQPRVVVYGLVKAAAPSDSLVFVHAVLTWLHQSLRS